MRFQYLAREVTGIKRICAIRIQPSAVGANHSPMGRCPLISLATGFAMIHSSIVVPCPDRQLFAPQAIESGVESAGITTDLSIRWLLDARTKGTGTSPRPGLHRFDESVAGHSLAAALQQTRLCFADIWNLAASATTLSTKIFGIFGILTNPRGKGRLYAATASRTARRRHRRQKC